MAQQQRQQSGEDHVPVGQPSSQAGDSFMNSVRPQDVQNIRLMVDIGGRTIEIPLKGNLVLDRMTPDGAAAARGDTEAEGQALGPQRRAPVQDLPEGMRGWVLTVATLFVGIAFQAAIQPPAWVPDDWYGVLKDTKYGTRAVPGRPVITLRKAKMISSYMLLNTVTCATALILLVFVLFMPKSPAARLMLPFGGAIACMVALTYSLGISEDPHVFGAVLVVFFAYTVVMVCFFRFFPIHRMIRRRDHARRGTI